MPRQLRIRARLRRIRMLSCLWWRWRWRLLCLVRGRRTLRCTLVRRARRRRRLLSLCLLLSSSSLLAGNVGIAKDVIGSLGRRLCLRRVRLVLGEVLIVRRRVLVCPGAFWLRRDKTAIRPLRVGLRTRRRRYLRGMSIWLIITGASDDVPSRIVARRKRWGKTWFWRTSQGTRLTWNGLENFSPVINGCILACCGDHRSIGFRLSKP